MSDEFENQLKVESSNQKCANCGGNLTFDPTCQKLKCANCGSEFDFAKTQKQVKHEIVDGKIDTKEEVSQWASEMKVVKCQTCGAEVMLSGLEMSSVCPYCGSDYVANVDVTPGLKPDVIIPFVFSQENAGGVFLKGIKKKFFAPRALKQKLPASKIHGIYVPTFTFDADSVSKYHGVLIKTVTHRDSKGHTYTETITIPISGSQECTHRNYVVESSTKMNGKQMKDLLPYDFEQSFVYTPNYVRGFSIEHYCDELDECYDRAKKGMEAEIKRIILSKYSYSRVESFFMNTKYSDEFYSYRMLPVYSFEFDWKKKKYMVFMNGQTGKVGGGYPKSALKIAILVILGVLVAAGLIALVVMYMLNGGSN